MHGNLGMPRKNKVVIAREPNGRIQREGRPHTPTEVRRLRDAAIRGLRDQEWGTELGRLFLERSITEEMYAAGKRWREDAASYIGSIAEFPIKSASLQRGKSMPPDPDSENGQEQARKDVEGAERFFGAHAALVAAGLGAENAVRRLCEDDLSLCGLFELNNAKRGLVQLADHYGLTERRKSDVR